MFDCDLFFNTTITSKLGKDPKCSFEDELIMKVQLGKNPTIIDGDRITVKQQTELGIKIESFEGSKPISWELFIVQEGERNSSFYKSIIIFFILTYSCSG